MKTPHSTLRRRLSVTLATGVVTAMTLVGCASGGGTASGSDTDLDAALEAGGTITYWSWTPSAEAQVEAFEKEYPNVTVDYVNAGTGNDHYTKMQNAIKAGSGGPDVAQVEYYAVPQFAFADSLLDLTPYGMDDLESKFTESTWNHMVSDSKLYGLPQDSGPMALFYNKTVFDANGIEVPVTWDEYVAAAETINASDPDTYITTDSGDAGFATSMIWQAGGQPFTVDGSDVTINLADEGTQKWTDTWNELVEKRLLSSTPGFSEDWFKGLGDGSIASLIIGAWMPGVLESSVAEGSGDWRVAPIPTYDGEPVTAENGGGGQVVLKQSKNPALAAAFLRWLNSSDESLQVFGDSGGFPSTVAQLEDPEFTDYESEYFGGQKINEVLSQSATEVQPGWSYLPFQVYGNSIFGDTVGQSYANAEPLEGGLARWEERLVKYGTDQGFAVTD